MGKAEGKQSCRAADNLSLVLDSTVLLTGRKGGIGKMTPEPSTSVPEPTSTSISYGNVLGARVAAVSRDAAAEHICARAVLGEGGYICAAPVHSIMEGFDDPSFRQVLNEAALVVPDGLPVAVALRLQGFRGQPRVAGPDLMLELCRRAAASGIPVGFYGSSDECLALLRERLPAKAPGLVIAYTFSPPFRALSEEEDAAIVDEIQASGTRLLFIGLGCPRQEIWMRDHQHRLSAVMVGVGAAFDFHAGLLKRAPTWMQRTGLEWFYRLVMEPRRLWWRYLKHNPRFVLNTGLQAIGLRKFPIPSR